MTGAEGAWSKVRGFLFEEKPIVSMISSCNLLVPQAKETAPGILKMVNCGSIFSFSDGKSIMVQQMNGESNHVSAWLQQNEGSNTLNTKGVVTPTKEEICKPFNNWSLELLGIIQAATGDIKRRSLYMLSLCFK